MDITSAIFDPELGCTAFTVERITYTRSRAGTTSRSTTTQAMGCIHPGTPGSFRCRTRRSRPSCMRRREACGGSGRI